MKSFISILILGNFWVISQPVFNDESLQKIYEYRIKVQKSAFADTMKLCIAYRKARGLVTPQLHTIHGDFNQHKDPNIRDWAQKMDQKYGVFESASLQSWMKILVEGTKQPFSAMGGLKSDFNEAQIDYKGYSFKVRDMFERWFLSLYSVFLVESDGFLEASLHCLGDLSMNQIEEEILNFRFTILFFDTQASAQSYNLMFWTGEYIFELLFKGTLLALSPISKRVVSSVRSWNRSIDELLEPHFFNYPRLKKGVLYSGVAVGTTGLGYVGISYLIKKNQEKQKIQNQLKDLIFENLEFTN